MARLKNMDFVLRVKNGTWTDKDELNRKVATDNRKILLMNKFRHIFHNYEEIRG